MTEVKQIRKLGFGYYVFTIIVAVLVVAIGITQYRMTSFKADIRNNLATVNTSQLIQEYRVWSFEQSKDPSSQTITPAEKYLKDMQNIVNEISDKYDVILFEKGAVVNDDFVDFTEELRNRLQNRGYEFLKEQ